MGTFAKSQRPVLAGTYVDFAIAAPNVIAQSIGRTVLVCFTHTWGPVETPVALQSLQDFVAQFGGDPTNPTSGYIAVYNAFKGEGSADFGGAGQVIAFRMASSSKAKATHSLMNTAGSPVAAIAVSAKYEGTFGNGLRLTTQDHAADVTKAELIILNGSAVLETYVYTDSDITNLVAQINANSAVVTASMLVTGTGLASVTSVALTGGLDGATLTGTDYTRAMASLELQRFGILSFENLTDATITQSVKAWSQGQNAAGRRFFTVFGGALDEVISDAVTRSAALDDPNIINVGVGSVRDNALLNSSKVPIVLSTAQLAPRVAGILANRGERYSMTFAKLVDVDLLNGASTSDIARAYDTGVIVFSRSSDREATVRLEKGLTTFIDLNDPARPRAIFSVPKYVATMQGLQEDLVAWANENIIGRTTVDNDTRTAVLAQINVFMALREAYGGVQPGWTAYVDPTPPPSDDDPFVAFVIAAKFGRSTEQVYFTAQLG